MKKKRVMALVMAGLMAGTLAGCGGSSSSSTTATSQSSAAATTAADAATDAAAAVTTEAAAEAETESSSKTKLVANDEAAETSEGSYQPENGATIEVFTVKEEIVGVIDNIISEFEEKYPGVTVNHTYGSDGETVLATRLASNDVPDVMQVYSLDAAYKADYDAGYLMDLTNESFMNNIGNTILDITKYEGVQFSMPVTVSTYAVYYRKDLFEQAGINSVPATYDEFIEDLQKLQDSGIEAPVALDFMSSAGQISERLCGELNPDCPTDFQAVADGEYDASESKTLQTYAKFLTDIKPYATKDALGMDRDAAVQDIVNGTSAVMFNGSWLLSQFLTADANIDIGYFPMPSPLLDTPQVAINVDTSWAIGSDTQYPEACKAFLDFLSQADIATEYYNVDGNISYVNGVKYDKTQLMDVYNTVMAGNAFATVGNSWPTFDLRDDIAAAAQGYLQDGDADAFYEACGEAIDFYYNQQ